MFTGIVLVVLAVACRLLSPEFHIWNFVPAGAVALYAGARLPRKWAWLVPIAAMFVSDQILNHGGQYPITSLTRWTVYATLAATTALGWIARSPKVRPWMLPGLSISASLLFFVTTNFATWAEWQLYPRTWAGLTECYIMALPFFGNSMAADLLGTCVLFSLGSAFERAVARISRAWSSGTSNAQETAELSEVV